jgi:hypothetical protein
MSGTQPDEPGGAGAPRRRSRRDVRLSGTVGSDESVLRSTVPAAPQAERVVPPPAAEPVDRSPADRSPADRSSDALLAVRSADDGDDGWGDRASRENDDRLRQDKPPHW